MIQSAWQGSLAGRLWQGGQAVLAPWRATSVVARWIEPVSLAAMLALLMVSPLVGTGLNAVLVLAAAGLALMRALLLPGAGVSSLWWGVLAYLGAHLIAAGFSPYPVVALKGLAKMAVFVLGFYVFVTQVRGAGRIRLVMWALALAAAVVAGYGIYQWFIKVPPLALWDDSQSVNVLTRVYSTLRNPNLLAGYLLAPLALSTALAIGERGLLRLLAASISAMQVVCIYWTYSRGGWLAMAVMGAVGFGWFVWHRGARVPKWVWVALLALVLAGGAVVAVRSPALVERVRTMFTVRGHSSNSFRANVWSACLRMVKNSPVVGIGPGNDVFKKVYPLYMVSGFEALGAYNVFLEILVEAGLIGIAAFVALLVAIGKLAWRKGRAGSVVAMACMAALCGTLVHGLVDTVWYRPPVQLLFWLVLAMVDGEA